MWTTSIEQTSPGEQQENLVKFRDIRVLQVNVVVHLFVANIKQQQTLIIVTQHQKLTMIKYDITCSVTRLNYIYNGAAAICKSCGPEMYLYPHTHIYGKQFTSISIVLHPTPHKDLHFFFFSVPTCLRAPPLRLPVERTVSGANVGIDATKASPKPPG